MKHLRLRGTKCFTDYTSIWVFTLVTFASAAPRNSSTSFLSWNFPGKGYLDPSITSRLSHSSNEECTGQPVNPFLSSGAWSTTHRNSYSQSSTSTSFLKGRKTRLDIREGEGRENGGCEKSESRPSGNATDCTLNVKANYQELAITMANPIADYDFLFAPALVADPISLLYTPDNRYIWGSSFTTTFKVDRSGPTLRIVDTINKKTSSSSNNSDDLFHGAYSVLSNEVRWNGKICRSIITSTLLSSMFTLNYLSLLHSVFPVIERFLFSLGKVSRYVWR